MRVLFLCLALASCGGPAPEPMPVPPTPPEAVAAPRKPAVVVSPAEREAWDYAVSPDATAAGMAIYRYLLLKH